jgi:RHS repeat-associated protein
VESTYTYDMAGQLTDITHANGGTVLARSAYTLDVLSRRTSTCSVGGVPSPRVTSYTANALNQYTQVAGAAFAYDANGNLTHDGKQTYRYDAQNRLLGVEPVAPTTGAIRAEFAYDARNRAVARTYHTLSKVGTWVINQADSRALTYDTTWNLLAERTRNGTQVGEYIHGQRTNEVLVTNLKSQNVYPLADGLGSVVALASDNGKVVERFRYSAYGHPMSLSATYQAVASSLSNYRFLFTGREWLGAVGLNEHRNRYYNVNLGRWITTDPIGFSGGDINLHRYVNNRPVLHVDLMGLACGSGSTQDALIPDGFGSWDFNSACEWHDSCYSNISMSKTACDDGFYDRMTEACARADASLLCYAIAGLYKSAVAVLGCGPYKNGQKKAGNNCPKCS